MGNRPKLIHKFTSDYSTNQFWDGYRLGMKEDKKKLVVDRVIYRKVIRDYNKEVLRLMLDEGRVFKVPYGLGYICITKQGIPIGFLNKKTNKPYLKVDYKQTKELKQAVYHLNEHTDNNYYRFRWMRLFYSVGGTYKFRPAFHAKQDLGATIFKGKVDYREYKMDN